MACRSRTNISPSPSLSFSQSLSFHCLKYLLENIRCFTRDQLSSFPPELLARLVVLLSESRQLTQDALSLFDGASALFSFISVSLSPSFSLSLSLSHTHAFYLSVSLDISRLPFIGASVSFHISVCVCPLTLVCMFVVCPTFSVSMFV